MTVSKRNARLILAVSFLSDLLFILPIWLLFGTDVLGLSTTLTTALFMTIWLGSGLLEVPTGALADRLGRRRMFLVGAGLLALYPLVYIWEMPVAVIFGVSLVAAFGSALRSGALIPLAHEAYRADKRSEEAYHAFLSTEKTLTFTARALSGVCGGLLYTFDPRAPYVAMFAVYIAMCIVGFFVIDKGGQRSELSNRRHVVETIRAMRGNRFIVMLAGVFVSSFIVAEAIWTAYQPFFASDNLNPQEIGIIFSVIALLSALGAYGTRLIMKRWGVLSIEAGITIAVLLTAYMLFLPYTIAHVLAIVPMSVAVGMASMPMVATVQKYIKPAFHSTALSVVSMLQFVVYGVASLYVGVLIDVFGVAATRKILFVEALIIATVVMGFYYRQRHVDVVLSSSEEAPIVAIPPEVT